MAIDTLIFDFDGVIIDTETPDYVTWQAVFDAHGVELDRGLWSGLIGGGIDRFDVYQHLEDLVEHELDRDAIREDRRRRYLDAVEANPVLPGVRELVLEATKLGLKLGVASSSTRDWVEGHLANRGLLAYFHSIRGRDDVRRVKPDPELYAAALDALGARPHTAMAIEDSPNGVTAAKSAGLFCVAVPNTMTRTLPLDHADVLLDSLADVTLGILISAATASRP